MRPVDLAREHGVSTQAVRNYEDAGILPAATRTEHGYRTYTPMHAQAVRTFRALTAGHGHAMSTAIMCAVNSGDVDAALQTIDDAHAQLREERATLRSVEHALAGVQPAGTTRGGVQPAGTNRGGVQPAGTTRGGVQPVASSGAGLFIGPLAHKLGVEPATLRKWERAGLVRPDRDRKTGYRVYAESAVRDAQLIRQLRRGGFALSRIAPLIAHVRSAGGVEPLVDLMDDWRDRIHARGRAMLSGAAELDRYLVLRNPDGRVRPELPDAPPSVPVYR
ncbi:TioE family transcriptional regulator [Rhodococcus sp. 14-2470-1a]|uniref:TioE family transcriptional regulator n=1 Tax=Rhodococcus sp. 14-2470-1a TaxID=2023150 RepID=UPI000B9C5786|nr:TioE family transcriptional regulator [Rhodococcus sp. 14-2470-1a]OZF53012.1 MerR family transcriptional regulator [Rhodococcus sp. 14-2470-1a]